MRAKSNQNGNEKQMAKMGTTCPLKYLCSLLSQDTLPRAGEAVPHEGVREPLSPSLISRKGGCDGELGFPTSTVCSVMGKAGCRSSFTDPQTVHSKAWPRAGVFSARDVARRGLGQNTWSLAYAQRLPWPSLP